MTIIETIKHGTKELKLNDIPDSNLISKEILCVVLNEDRQYLIIHKDNLINESQYNVFCKLINEIILGKPLQYITHKQEFMGYNFYVDENVLIPQPDTEIIVERVIEISNNIYMYGSNLEILDLCTGSGAIAIALDKILNKYDNIKIYASDISKEAIEIAKKNSKKNNANVTFIQSDMFKNINKKFDIIVSNPPYIETDVIKTLPKDVQSEPYIALDGGKDGMNFYKIIASNADKYINEKGYICLEIGYDQAQIVSKLFNDTKKYTNIQVLKDLSGNDRCIVAKLGE